MSAFLFMIDEWKCLKKIWRKFTQWRSITWIGFF